MSTKAIITCFALALLASAATAEESKTIGQKLCSYFSILPGCKSKPAEEDDNSLQAINCGAFPMSEWCVKQRATWTAEEKREFWSLVNQQLKSFEEEEEQAMTGAVNCQAYPNTPFCIKARQLWEQSAADAAVFEEEIQKVDMDKVIKIATLISSLEEEQKFKLGKTLKTVGKVAGTASQLGLLEEDEQKINIRQTLNTALTVAQTAQQLGLLDEEQKFKLGKTLKTVGKVAGTASQLGLLEEEQPQLGGAISCQAFPNAPFCVALRERWAEEAALGQGGFVSGVFDEDAEQWSVNAGISGQGGRPNWNVGVSHSWDEDQAEQKWSGWKKIEKGAKRAAGVAVKAKELGLFDEEEVVRAPIRGLVNCRQFANAPSCVQKTAPTIREASLGALNCQAYPDAPFCVKARALWAKEAAEAAALEKEAEQGMMGAVNCQAYPNTPFCIKARALWAKEAAEALEEEEEEEEQAMAVNCQAYPNTPFCIKARQLWEQSAADAAVFEEEQSMMGAVNCQAYPNTPFCIKARALWAKEAAEAAKQ